MAEVQKMRKKLDDFLDAHGGGYTVMEAMERLGYVRVRVDQLMRSGQLSTFHLWRTPVISKKDVEERMRMKKERTMRRRKVKSRS